MISVITTTYNCAAYISQAIRSILNQTFRDFEYLVIDDGSTDNTEKVVRKIKDTRIRFYKIAHVGRSSALNYGLKLANYEIIALMDADDISHSLRFEKQLALYNNTNQFIFCDTAYFIGKKIKYIIRNSSNKKTRLKKLVLHGHFNNSSSIFNKNFILANGGFDEKLKAYEDYDLWLRLRNKIEFIVIPEIYHFVRLRLDSMTTSHPEKSKLFLYSIQEQYFNDLLSSFGINDEVDQNIIKGWREFFYGEKKLARKYWCKVKYFDRGKKVNFVFILSYLPTILLEYSKNNRLRLRFEYLLNQFTSFKLIQKEFDEIQSKLLANG